jgi:hypothetical protein
VNYVFRRAGHGLGLEAFGISRAMDDSSDQSLLVGLEVSDLPVALVVPVVNVMKLFFFVTDAPHN